MEGGIDERERLSVTVVDTSFFGIFLRLLIETVVVELFGEMIFNDGWENDSCLIMTFEGDWTVEIDVCSVLIEVFGGFLFIDFFNTIWEFVTGLVFDGIGVDSFFFILIVIDWLEDLISFVDWDLISFVDERGLDTDGWKE